MAKKVKKKLKRTDMRKKGTMEFRTMKKKFKSVRPCQVIIHNIPRDLRDRFKAWCAVRGYSVTGKLRHYMMACITEDEE